MKFDVFFISYNETDQEENWQRVLILHPTAIRLHGIKGIDIVHVICDNLAKFNWFWTVDGDNYLKEPLKHPGHIDPWLNLIMFTADDPISNEPTNLGGVKLWRKGSLVNRDMSKGDFCLNAVKPKSTYYHPAPAFSITKYNSSPYDAWKTAFRHCVKLTTILKDRPQATNIDRYISHWKSCKDLDNGSNNALWCYNGYLDATKYVNNNIDPLVINDYDWLKNYFKEKYDA